MNTEFVILAGGAGTRLWPASDKVRPKQFLPIPQDKTLLEQAYKRAQSMTNPAHIWIVTLESQVKTTMTILPYVARSMIIAEPTGRNSAPAITTAAFYIEKIRGEPVVMMVMTADHYIPDLKKFTSNVQTGIDRATAGESLLTFGLKVSSPKSDYGYIEVESSKSKSKVLKAKRFIEKPTLQKAKAFKKAGRFFWNSGMFVWRSDTFLREMKECSPEIYQPLSRSNWSQLERLEGVYHSLPNISIDYALMERSKKVEVVPSSFEWSDVGTWHAVYEVMPKDKNKNGIIGKGRVVEGEGNLIYTDGKPVYLYDVDNLVVVDAQNATLITTREKSKELKKFLEKI